MADILDKLRKEAAPLSSGLGRQIGPMDSVWLSQAADEIESLRRELAEARDKALEEAASKADHEAIHRSSQEVLYDEGWEGCARHLRSAIRSLKEKGQ